MQIWNLQSHPWGLCWSWESGGESLERGEAAGSRSGRAQIESFPVKRMLWEDKHRQRSLTCWTRHHYWGNYRGRFASTQVQRCKSWKGTFFGRGEVSLEPRQWGRRNRVCEILVHQKSRSPPATKKKDVICFKDHTHHCISRRQGSWTKKPSEPL